MTIHEIAIEYFAQHPTVNVFHFTSDNQAFFEMHFAEVHAACLKDSSIQTIERGFQNVNPAAGTAPLANLEDLVAGALLKAVNDASDLANAETPKVLDNESKPPVEPAKVEAPKKAAPKKAAPKK